MTTTPTGDAETIEGLRLDRDQWRELARLEAENAEGLRESLAKAEGALNAVDQERDGFAQLCALRLSERDDAREQAASFQAMYRQACDWRDAKIAAAEARALKAESQVAEAKGALEPFAEASKLFDDAADRFEFPKRPDDYRPACSFTHGQLRRARSTLASLEPKETDDAG